MPEDPGGAKDIGWSGVYSRPANGRRECLGDVQKQDARAGLGALLTGNVVCEYGVIFDIRYSILDIRYSIFDI